METQDIINKPIGTKEHTALKPAKVKIVSVLIKDKTNEGKLMKAPLAEIMVKHPDKEELLSMTKIKIIRLEKVQLATTWVSLDEDQNIVKSSALAELMRYLKVDTVAGLYGKEIDTMVQSDTNNYLCLKSY